MVSTENPRIDIEIRSWFPATGDNPFNTLEWGLHNLCWANQTHISFLELKQYRVHRAWENSNILARKRHVVTAPTDIAFFCGVQWKKHIQIYFKSLTLVPILIDFYLERTIQNQLVYYMKRFYDERRRKKIHRNCLKYVHPIHIQISMDFY